MPTQETLVQRVRERMDFNALFSEFLALEGHAPWKRARCIFHEDSTPSMGVNVEDGYFLCRNPECGVRGDFIDFYRRVRNLDFRDALGELAQRVGIDVPRERQMATAVGGADGQPGLIDEAIVEAACFRLLNTPSAMAFLLERRGLNRETVQQWKLGHDGQRYYIPIRDFEGQCVNIRRYKPGAPSSEKMISWRTGFGTARLFPLEIIQRAAQTDETVVIFEGEMDCLLALQHGFAAICATGGAGTWREQWNVMFSGRDVAICYDIDGPGQVGRKQVAQALHGIARRIRLIDLPIREPENADFTDYIVGHGYSAEDFIQLLGRTPEWQPTPSDAVAPRRDQEPAEHGVDESAIPMVHLSAASQAQYYNKELRYNIMVSGKSHAPYLIPDTVHLQCSMPGKPMCASCPVGDAGGTMQKRLEYEDNEMLQMLDVKDAEVQRQIKAHLRVPSKCSYVRATVTNSLNVEEIQLIPEIDRATSKDAPYVTTRAFFVGHGLETNRSYLMTGTTVPTPERQHATHLVHTAIKSQSNIDSFRMTPDAVAALRVFQPAESGVAALWRKIDEIYEDLENHTRIWSRRDLMLTVDLVYHSVIRFDFQGERLVRGWTEALVIGDSRTGKSTIASRLMDYYGAGEFISGENTSIAGLVGGLHQIGTSWFVQWGRIPVNDRRLVFVDEAGNLPPEQIARLSSMRSSGIAEIIKVHTERTTARTRQVWISNPRENRPLSSFSQGVLAVKSLIGAPEDIARFDMVATAASGDVSLAMVNRAERRSEPRTYTSYLCHQRVMWAWSREPEHVVWTEDATAKTLELAMVQGQKYQYATDIPLVEPNEQRIKIARLAVAVAVLFFSTDDTGERVLVLPEHVEFAVQFLEKLYAKPSLSFTEYAATTNRRFELRNEDQIRAKIPGSSIRQLMEQEQLTLRDLQELFGLEDRGALQKTVALLRENGFLRRVGSSYYVKTPAAIRWLRNEISQGSEASGALAPSQGYQEEIPDASEDDAPPF